MADYDIRTLQLRLVEVLADFHQMCKEQGLTYYLMYGSMLGAHRHGGFIPWDDDIDIGLPRADYERLIQHSREWLPKHLEFVCAENDGHYPVAFGKLQDARTTLIERAHYKYLGGIYCDVYPIDGAPSGWLRRRLHILHYFLYFRLLYLVHRDPYRHGHGVRSLLPLWVQKCFTLQGVQRKIREILLRYPLEKSNLVCLYNDHTHAVIPKDVFGKPQLVKFENLEVNAVADIPAYLKKCFGPDYMQLPPEEKRHWHHYHYLDLNHPYKDLSSLPK